MSRKNQSHRKNERRALVLSKNEKLLEQAKKGQLPSHLKDQIGMTDRVKSWIDSIEKENELLKKRIGDGG